MKILPYTRQQNLGDNARIFDELRQREVARAGIAQSLNSIIFDLYECSDDLDLVKLHHHVIRLAIELKNLTQLS